MDKQPLYLVQFTWNDGVKTTFVVYSKNMDTARRATETVALNMWDGYIVSTRVETITLPGAPNLPQHVMTDNSGWHEPESEARNA